MNYRSTAQLAQDIHLWSVQLQTDIDLVVGVPRSGLLPASMLALHRNIPLGDLEGLLEGRILETGPRGSHRISADRLTGGGLNILVMDDCVATGKAMKEVQERLQFIRGKHNVIVGAVYLNPGAPASIDVWYDTLSMPYIFEWNLMHSWVIEHGCLDMDGVLCRDPESHEDDDGPAYRHFLKTVEPYWLPTKTIARIVTCRLEKYRPETEEWLARHGVKYEQLTMMDYPDARSRDRDRKHGSYKASIYRSRDRYQLFVESSEFQARQIAHWTGKPVFCIETMEMLMPSINPFARPSTEAKDFHSGMFGGKVQRGSRKAMGALRSYARMVRGHIRRIFA